MFVDLVVSLVPSDYRSAAQPVPLSLEASVVAAAADMSNSPCIKHTTSELRPRLSGKTRENSPAVADTLLDFTSGGVEVITASPKSKARRSAALALSVEAGLRPSGNDRIVCQRPAANELRALPSSFSRTVRAKYM